MIAMVELAGCWVAVLMSGIDLGMTFGTFSLELHPARRIQCFLLQI
jgi:hypothetical protein